MCSRRIGHKGKNLAFVRCSFCGKEEGMITLIVGNEPYLLEKEEKKIRAFLGEVSEFIQTFEEWKKEVKEAMLQHSFFAERTTVFLKLEKLGASEGLFAYLKSPIETCDFYIFATKVDKGTKVFKELKKNHRIVVCDKLKKKEGLDFIDSFLKGQGLSPMDQSVKEYFLTRVRYETVDECSLYTIQTLLTQMSFVAEGVITKKEVDLFVSPPLEDKVYLLSSYLIKKDGVMLMKSAQDLLLQKESVIAMLSLLLRSYRLAYKASLLDCSVKEKEIRIGVPAYQYSGLRGTPESFFQGMKLLQGAVNDIKGGYSEEIIFFTVLGELLDSHR